MPVPIAQKNPLGVYARGGQNVQDGSEGIMTVL